jgi:hypothetical protein
MITSKIKNLSRLAVVSGFAMLSAVALSPKAQAQNVNVDFTGSTTPTCSATAAPGALAVVDNKQLTAGGPAGTAGTLTVTCNSGTTFTITGITDNGSVLAGGQTINNIDAVVASILDGATVIKDGGITDGGTTVPALNVASGVQVPGSNKVYDVRLNIYNIAASPNLPTGDYKVRVAITLTPQ